jgi:hypothetical protein
MISWWMIMTKPVIERYLETFSNDSDRSRLCSNPGVIQGFLSRFTVSESGLIELLSDPALDLTQEEKTRVMVHYFNGSAK